MNELAAHWFMLIIFFFAICVAGEIIIEKLDALGLERDKLWDSYECLKCGTSKKVLREQFGAVPTCTKCGDFMLGK